MVKTSLILTKQHWIFHNLNDGRRSLKFQVKAFDLASEISYIVIDGFNCTTDTGKTSSITLLEGQFLDSKNGRGCCRPNLKTLMQFKEGYYTWYTL